MSPARPVTGSVGQWRKGGNCPISCRAMPEETNYKEADPEQASPQDVSRAAGNPIEDWWDDFRIATAFLTRLPIPFPATGGSLAQASRTFPLVGVLVGGISAIVYAIAVNLGLTSLLGAGLAVAAGLIATGALHEDGLADLADGLGARGDGEAKLAAMRDSHIGVFGTLALILIVLLNVIAIGAIALPGEAAAALIAAHAGSRALLPLVMHRFPQARRDGLAVNAGRPSQTTAIAALILGAIILLILEGPARGLVAAICACLALLLALLSRRVLGGITGDVLGAIESLARLAILLALVASR
jgi:adenosylcobinamide-GDP ribazoletransferase